MQQTIPSRFRDSSHGSIQGLNDKRSTVAFSPSDHLDSIFQAVRQQVERWGENAKWKIELILLTDQQQQQSTPTNVSSSTTTITTPTTAFTSKQHYHKHYEHELNRSSPSSSSTIRPYHSQGIITRSNNRSETWNIPYAADLQQSLRNAVDRIKYLENMVRTQEERLKQLKSNNFIQTLETMHSTTIKELKEHHQIEMKLLQKENQTLAKKFMRISSTLQKIEQIGLFSDDKDTQQSLDKKQLIEDRKILLRKLHLNELRLRARDAELNYLHNVIWTYRHTHTIDNDDDDDDDQEDNNMDNTDDDDKSINNYSLTKKQNNNSTLSQKQHNQQQEEGEEELKRRPISALDSLSILADQMLNDPDFGSEGKEPFVSPDSKTLLPSILLNENNKQNSSKKKVESNPSTCIKKEIMEDNNITTTTTVDGNNSNNTNNNKRKRKEEQPSIGSYRYRNIKQGEDGDRNTSSSNNNNSSIRPSSAFHTITHIHHPYTPSKHYQHHEQPQQQQQQQNRYYIPSPLPVNIIPRLSPIKDQETHVTTTNVNVLSASPSYNSSSFISSVPSSSSTAYQHSPYSYHPRQQQQQNDYYYSSNKKQRWSVNISNKKTNTPPSM